MPARLTSYALALGLTISALAALPAAPAAAAPAAAAPAAARANDGFSALPDFTINKKSDRLRVAPKHYEAYAVDPAAVRRDLSSGRIAVPDPSGRLVNFDVVEDSVMEPELQAAHPEIRTYAGRALDGTARSIRLDVTPMGFHASVRSPGGNASWYVDPVYNRRGASAHLSYFRAALPRATRPLIEGDLHPRAGQSSAEAAGPDPQVGPPGGDVTRKTYQLAFVTDPTYATYFGTANVFAEKATLINRVNQPYNDDMAIHFVLVAGTDTKLNLDTVAKATGPNGPCGANACFTPDELATCGGGTLDRNEFVLGQIIGAQNYDIGHIGLGVNGGGIAGLGVVGGAFKADGCTGLPFPEGDFYAIDYVAHEIGHQMGGPHTFNGTQGNCSPGNRNVDPFTSQVEPGSGSSIMAYAGICAQDNLQPHSDPYFSFSSIVDITATVADDAATVDEQQVVNLAGFDGTDAFTISCAGCATSSPIVNGASYNAVQLASAVSTATGETVTALEVSGYDGASQPNANGFTVDFTLLAQGIDIPTLVITPTAGTFTTFTGVVYNGGETTNEGEDSTPANDNPTVTAPADKSIPIRTPFTLTGSATDPGDEANLTYLWEQTDPGGATGTALTDNNKMEGPLFRMFGTYADVSLEESLESPSPDINLADGNFSRTFPDLAQVVADNTNAETGSCPAPPASPAPVPIPTIDCYSEFLPTAGYASSLTGGPMTFRLAARDQFPTGGGYAFDDVTLTPSSSAGPFLVTSRGTAGTPADSGTSEAVTWSVAGTDTAAFAPNVRITLSLDGGQTFPIELLASTPNDGTENVTWPNVTTQRARVKVEAVGNYFFDVNDADFSIQGPLSVTTPSDPVVQYSDQLPAGVTVDASSTDVDGDQLTATIEGLPGLTVTRSNESADTVRPGTARFTLTGQVNAEPDTYYPMTLTVSEPPGGSTAVASFDIVVAPEDALVDYNGDLTASGSTATVPVHLSAEVSDAADGSAGDVSTATVTFVDRDTDGPLCSAPVTGGPTSGTASCTANLARSGETTTYHVGMVVGGRYTRDQAGDDVTITITGPDGTAPQTTIVAGPANKSFVLTRKKSFSNRSSEPGSTFVCSLDGKAVNCGALARLSFKVGTHVYQVAARDADGNLDATPARRTFISPYNDGQLKRVTDGWKRHKDKKSYRGAWMETSKRGQELSRKAAGIRKIALVAHTGPGFGRVAIFLGNQRLKTISLASPKLEKRVLINVKSFGRAVAGTVRIVTLGKKTVRIDGLGIYTG